jgi:GntR family transcriptional regulator/MocR family aminotransferase
VLLTPGHQYPLGSTLSPERRHQLLRWAAEHDTLVIEDDYDGEFRYDASWLVRCRRLTRTA